MSSKSTNSVAIRRLKEQKSDLFRKVVAIEDFLVATQFPEMKTMHEVCILPRSYLTHFQTPHVGSIDSPPTLPFPGVQRDLSSSDQLFSQSSSIFHTNSLEVHHPMTPLLRMHTQVIDDSASGSLPYHQRSSKKSQTECSSSNLDPIHLYINVDEVERVWHGIDDSMVALQREALIKRHELVRTDSNLKSASINLENLRKTAEIEAKIWADTIESSRLKSSLDLTELNQRRARVETIRLKAISDKVENLKRQADAMSVMKREIYERLSMEIEECQMKLYLDRLKMAKELSAMRLIEEECREYEIEKAKEMSMERLECKNLEEEDKAMRALLSSEESSLQSLLDTEYQECEASRLSPISGSNSSQSLPFPGHLNLYFLPPFLLSSGPFPCPNLSYLLSTKHRVVKPQGQLNQNCELFLEKLEISRELSRMRKIEAECQKYSIEKSMEEKKERLECNQLEEEDVVALSWRRLWEEERQLKRNPLEISQRLRVEEEDPLQFCPDTSSPSYLKSFAYCTKQQVLRAQRELGQATHGQYSSTSPSRYVKWERFLSSPHLWEPIAICETE